MTPLRQQMVEAMVAHGLAKRTQETHVQALVRMSGDVGRSPDGYLIRAQFKPPQQADPLDLLAALPPVLLGMPQPRPHKPGRTPPSRA